MVAKAVITKRMAKEMERIVGKYAGGGRIGTWREMPRESTHKTSILDLSKAY